MFFLTMYVYFQPILLSRHFLNRKIPLSIFFFRKIIFLLIFLVAVRIKKYEESEAHTPRLGGGEEPQATWCPCAVLWSARWRASVVGRAWRSVWSGWKQKYTTPVFFSHLRFLGEMLRIENDAAD